MARCFYGGGASSSVVILAIQKDLNHQCLVAYNDIHYIITNRSLLYLLLTVTSTSSTTPASPYLQRFTVIVSSQSSHADKKYRRTKPFSRTIRFREPPCRHQLESTVSIRAVRGTPPDNRPASDHRSSACHVPLPPPLPRCSHGRHLPPGADPGGGRLGAEVGTHPWDGPAPFKIHHSMTFNHQSITGRPPLGGILYPPLTSTPRSARDRRMVRFSLRTCLPGSLFPASHRPPRP